MNPNKPASQELEITASSMKGSVPKREIEKPPLFSSWLGWYGLVIGFLISLILIFLFITNSYS